MSICSNALFALGFYIVGYSTFVEIVYYSETAVYNKEFVVSIERDSNSRFVDRRSKMCIGSKGIINQS